MSTRICLGGVVLKCTKTQDSSLFDSGGIWTNGLHLSGTENSVTAITDMFIQDQFINACPRDLAAHLRERVRASLNDLAASAECYLIVHGKKFYSGFQPYEGVSPQLNTVEASGEKSAAGESVGKDPVFRVQKNWTPCS